MSTDVYWNDAKPPRSQGEHGAAEWLVSEAREIGITSVTEDNRSEWLWRFAFIQQMRGRRFGGKDGYERAMWQLASVLDRFRTATLVGRVVDHDREQFVEEFTRLAIDAAREQADAVIEEDSPDGESHQG
jgi:hypothetical protein